MLRLPYQKAAKQIAKAYEKKTEERAWDMWVRIYPDMVVPKRKIQTADNRYKLEPYLSFKPFSEFLQQVKQKPISKRPAEEIQARADQIRKQIADRKGGDQVAAV